MKILLPTLIFLVSLTANAQSSYDHSQFDFVLKKYVKNGFVDYKSIKTDSKLDDYLKKLSTAKPNEMGKDEQLAFWINVYNAYTIKLIIDNYPVKSIKDIGFPLIASPWDKQLAVIDEKKYSLNNIEHDIIRKNFNEPKIHFALVCAAISCPPLRSEAYSGKLLNNQLNDQVNIFFSNKNRNVINLEKKQITISKIMDWYKSDFEKTGDYKQTIWNFFPKEFRTSGNVNEFKISYFDYDWSLNGK